MKARDIDDSDVFLLKEHARWYAERHDNRASRFYAIADFLSRTRRVRARRAPGVER